MDWLVALSAIAPGGEPSASLILTLVGAIVALVALVPKALDYILGRGKPSALAPLMEAMTKALQENAQNNGRLAAVLERLEASTEKGQEKILTTLQQHGDLLKGLDYRTREIREAVKDIKDRPPA